MFTVFIQSCSQYLFYFDGCALFLHVYYRELSYTRGVNQRHFNCHLAVGYRLIYLDYISSFQRYTFAIAVFVLSRPVVFGDICDSARLSVWRRIVGCLRGRLISWTHVQRCNQHVTATASGMRKYSSQRLSALIWPTGQYQLCRARTLNKAYQKIRKAEGKMI
jgi:hypothetical protein